MIPMIDHHSLQRALLQVPSKFRGGSGSAGRMLRGGILGLHIWDISMCQHKRDFHMAPVGASQNVGQTILWFL